MEVINRIEHIGAYAALTGDPRLAEAARIVLEAARTHHLRDPFAGEGTKASITLADQVNVIGCQIDDEVTLSALYPNWDRPISTILQWREMMADFSTGERARINSAISLANFWMFWYEQEENMRSKQVQVGDIRAKGLEGLNRTYRLKGQRAVFLTTAFQKQQGILTTIR